MERRFSVLGVTVVPDLPEGLVVHGFPAELRQVFTNLLTNAAEASGEKSATAQSADDMLADPPSPNPEAAVYLSAEPCPATIGANGFHREAGVMVTIEDRGHGIPEEALSHLFKPFFTTKGERGTGLGLWISRGIITKHGGSITLESSTDTELHGTTLSVFLAYNPVINAGGD